MGNNEQLELRHAAALKTARELEELNPLTAKFGLTLTAAAAQALSTRRYKALSDAGRVEFRGGVLKELAIAFCDSPYIENDAWEQTLADLQDCFYYFKSESRDTLTDEELIAYMRNYFDDKCEGSTDYLMGTSLEALCRAARLKSYGLEDEDE